MYAELLVAEGREAEALEYVNKVHRRAYGYDPDSTSPVDYQSLRIGQKEADYYKTVSGPGAAKTQIVWKVTNYAMPIPTSEFESNPSSGMVQTPGY